MKGDRIKLRWILQIFLHFPILLVSTETTLDIASLTTVPTTTIVNGKTKESDDEEVGVVVTTDQVMDPNIKITDVPDVDTEDWEPGLDKNKVIRDVAYYLRAHKFQDHDRRYYKYPDESESRLYQDFPKPPLRSLHWEVRRHCDASFVGCLRYLEQIVKLTALRREDDTVTIITDQKWKHPNHTQQILQAQKDCQAAQRRDDLTVPPFQGPIERFQWRTTVSYYMCWYTMLGVPELAIFGESCDNHANCQTQLHNDDPRADDSKPYACALYSFCPDHCCPMRHIRYTKDCFQSPLNPCYAENPPGNRRCTLRREENQDFASLLANKINVSCECRRSGFEWSSRFGLCVDINECVRGTHHCTQPGQVCFNMPGQYVCACRHGYVETADGCEVDARLDLMKDEEKKNGNETEKSLFKKIANAITGSGATREEYGVAVVAGEIALYVVVLFVTNFP